MENRANYVLIGAVTVIAFTLAMLFAIWLARVSLTREFSYYDVVFKGPARGIGAGTEVRFNGIRVGEVRSLKMDPQVETSVVARIRIGSSWPVRTDTDVRLEPIGLTGLNFIQISSADAKGPRVEQRLGGEVPRIEARVAALDQILESSETITQNATEALSGARAMLTKDNAERLERILRNLETVSQTLAAERGALRTTGEAAQELRDAARQFSVTARAFEDVASDSRGAIGRIGDAAGGVEAASNEAAVGALPDLAAASRDLRRLAVSLDRVATNVERSSALATVGEQKPVVRVRP